MIIKKNFHPLKVISYVKWEILFAICIAFLAYYFSEFLDWNIQIPFSVSAIMASALAIFIAFRNNSSYSRWWEARTQWSNIVNSSRTFARLIISFTDSHAHQSNYDVNKSENFKKEMIYLMIAFTKTLNYTLRQQNKFNDIQQWLSENEKSYFLNAQNKLNFLLSLKGKKIYQAMANGTLAGFDSFQLEGQLLVLTNYAGACERIKDTPLLRQYHYFTKLFLLVFILLLPFSLLPDFIKMEKAIWVIPVSVLISFIFSIIAKVGEVNEDPFENEITDVPMDFLCNTIERDLLEMLGEKDLPKIYTPQNGYLF
jgi:putative membrane protein